MQTIVEAIYKMVGSRVTFSEGTETPQLRVKRIFDTMDTVSTANKLYMSCDHTLYLYHAPYILLRLNIVEKFNRFHLTFLGRHIILIAYSVGIYIHILTSFPSPHPS